MQRTIQRLSPFVIIGLVIGALLAVNTAGTLRFALIVRDRFNDVAEERLPAILALQNVDATTREMVGEATSLSLLRAEEALTDGAQTNTTTADLLNARAELLAYLEDYETVNHAHLASEDHHEDDVRAAALALADAAITLVELKDAGGSGQAVLDQLIEMEALETTYEATITEAIALEAEALDTSGNRILTLVTSARWRIALFTGLSTLAFVAAAIYIRQQEKARTAAEAAVIQQAQTLRANQQRLRAIYEIEANTDLTTNQKLDALIMEGTKLLGLEMGIISHIEDSTYTVKHHYAPEAPLEDGQTFELGQTYCAITLNQEDVFKAEEFSNTTYKGHPAYAAFGLETYIGAPLIVNAEPYGTINFSAAPPRTRRFTPDEQDFVRLMGEWVSATIEAQQATDALRKQATQLAQSNEQLALARKEAEEANRLKSEFLATMSHELRTPLNAIIGYTDIQLKGMAGPLNEKQHNFMERTLANADHLLNLINDVLDLAKVEAGRVDLINEPFAPNNLAQEATRLLATLAESKGLTLKVEVDERLPETLIGDRARLKQMIINLVSNGIKFTQEGSVQLALRRPDPATWEIAVTDTGDGIPPDQQQIIFDEFRQVQSGSTRKHGGTGLGLAITRSFAMMMGGHIRVKSKVGEGSTFIITLPLTQAVKDDDQ